MAVLSPVYWQAITPAMREVLRFIGQCPFAERFYLALRLGHRRSVTSPVLTCPCQRAQSCPHYQPGHPSPSRRGRSEIVDNPDRGL